MIDKLIEQRIIITKLNTLEKILFGSLILYAINFFGFLEVLFGISKIPDDLFFWFIPNSILLIIGFPRASKRLLKKTYFFHFLTLAFLFFLSEQSFLRGLDYVPSYEYLIGFAKFYLIYVAFLLINKQNAIIKFVVKISLIGVGVIVFYFYYDYITTGGSKVLDDEVGDRFINNIGFHINGLSMICVYGIFISIISHFYESFSFKRTAFLISFFAGMVILNSSRGAFLMSAVLILVWLKNTSNKLSITSKIVLFLLISVTALLSLDQIGILSENVIVLRRLVNNEGTGRVTQSLANWYNFLDSPYVGKGQTLAGFDINLNTVRSNVHYMQTLASYGIFVFAIYMAFIYKVFGPLKFNFGKLSNMSLAIVVIAFLSYNWTLILPLSFIAYFNNTLNKSIINV